MPEIVIGDNQVRVKDSYAPAPIINLTLRMNGEEKPMVMDSLGQFVLAGFEPPTVTPTVASGGTAGVLTPSMWVAYKYVYAATKRYPLVENANTPDGSLAPRSNPSPRSVGIQVSGGGNSINVTVTKTTRLDVSEIWIFRTGYFSTQAEAQDAADSGICFYSGKVVNDGNVGTAVYSDIVTIVTSEEQIEEDNFVAENAQYCVYDDPYFYAIGNNAFSAPITVDQTGLVTLTNPWSPINPTGDKWYDGRNGQVVTMAGITDGGFDSYGSYYFKWLTASTAQLYFDKALTSPGSVNYTGTTVINIKGPSTILFRSKERNPFSWGLTITDGGLNTPAPYVYKVGGGQATAIAVVPVLNLLMISTEAPNKTFVLNLNGKGTPAFETSKREISGDFSTSNFWTTFSSKAKDGNTYLWFFDNKYFAICQTDGSTNIDISSPVFDSIRNLSQVAQDRLMSHGVYDPRLQISCMWFTTDGSTVQNDLAIIYHHPTDTWSVAEQRGILCSEPFLDRETNRSMVLIGTDTGRIGRAFDPDRTWDWLPTSPLGLWPHIVLYESSTTVNYQAESFGEEYVGIWCYIVAEEEINIPTTSPLQLRQRLVGSVRISEVTVDGGGSHFTFDKFRNHLGEEVADLDEICPNFNSGGSSEMGIFLFPGMIFCNGCKFYNFEKPLKGKKLSQIFATVDGVQQYSDPSISSIRLTFRGSLVPEYEGNLNEELMFSFTREKRTTNYVPPSEVDSNIYRANKPFRVDSSCSFRLSLQDIGYGEFKFYNYRLALPNA